MTINVLLTGKWLAKMSKRLFFAKAVQITWHVCVSGVRLRGAAVNNTFVGYCPSAGKLSVLEAWKHGVITHSAPSQAPARSIKCTGGQCGYHVAKSKSVSV